LSLIALPFGILGASLFSVVLGFRALGSVARIALIGLRPFLGVLQGLAAGAIGGAASFGRATALAFRFAGALGAATVAFRVLRKALGIGLAIEGLLLVYENWNKLVELFKSPLRIDVLFPDAPDWLKWLMKRTAQAGNWLWDAMSDPTGATAQRKMWDLVPDWLRSGDGNLDRWAPSFAGIGQYGVPEAMLQKPATKSGTAADVKAASQSMTTNNNSNNTVNVGGISVTVNATTNADPNAIGAATANAVGAKVRGSLSDAPHSAP
jgi:hypothetical protein